MNDHDACVCMCIYAIDHFYNSLMKNMMIIEIKIAVTTPIITFILMFFHLKIHIIVGIFLIDE